MPKYKETVHTVNETVKKYEYAHRVTIDNPLDRPPRITFHTSTVVEHDGQPKLTTFDRVLMETYDKNEKFDIIDLDGNVVGQSDYDTVFGLMYSLFFHVAEKTDGNGSV